MLSVFFFLFFCFDFTHGSFLACGDLWLGFSSIGVNKQEVALHKFSTPEKLLLRVSSARLQLLWLPLQPTAWLCGIWYSHLCSVTVTHSGSFSQLTLSTVQHICYTKRHTYEMYLWNLEYIKLLIFICFLMNKCYLLLWSDLWECAKDLNQIWFILI